MHRMANVTLTIDDDVLRRARIRALEQGTSVNALVRECIESFAGEGPAKEGLRSFIDGARHSRASSGDRGRSWTRDEVYDRPRSG